MATGNTELHPALSIGICIFTLLLIIVLFRIRIFSTESVITSDSAGTEFYIQSNFDDLPLAEQVNKITNEYFSTCSEIINHCKKYPFTPNCKKYCDDYYPSLNLSLNTTLNDTDVFFFTNTLTKDVFDAYDNEIKSDIINLGYFSACKDVAHFCKVNLEIEGCHKYCQKYLMNNS